MNQEAQYYLSKAKQIKNSTTKDGQLVKGTRYLTHRERTAKEDELANLREVLSPSNIAASSLSQEGRANMSRYHNFLTRDLTDNAPPTDLDTETRDELIKRERELAEEIKQGMLPVEVMRRNPPGAVGEHIKWERANKAKILEWKNLRRINNPDDDDEDLANVEMLRPSIAPNAVASFMADAQIPGHFAMTPLAKQNWPLGEPKIDTPLKQAEKREAELLARIKQLEAELKADSHRQFKKRNPMSDEQKQKLRERGLALAQKAKEARERKLQEQQPPMSE